MGRSGGPDLLIIDPLVSRSHARLEYDHDGVRICLRVVCAINRMNRRCFNSDDINWLKRNDSYIIAVHCGNYDEQLQQQNVR